MLVSKSIVLALMSQSAASAVRTWDSPAESHTIDKAAFYELTKRLIDLVTASLLLVTLSPLLLFVALLVRASSSGPAIFAQERLTKGGKRFTLYKFRTMDVDAEKGIGAVWAQRSDPRVTSIGRLLRLTRIDELPQLFNVVIGDMSLIGPRPERPELAAKLSDEIPGFYRRLEVRAGITGLAQVVSGYSASKRSYKRKVALDLIYIRRRSLILDLKIAIRTIGVMLTGFGAH